jgi:hypothetical protein
MLAEAVYQDRPGLRRLFAEFGQEFTIGVTAPPPKADMMIAQDDWHKRTRLKSAFVKAFRRRPECPWPRP